VIEVTHTDPPEVVFDLAQVDGSTLYRAERVASLYPDGVETTLPPR